MKTMSQHLLFAAKAGLAGNIFLFILKILAGLLSNSIAVISDALNSLTDIITSIAIHISIKMSQTQPDEDHPFGHNRAEPLAGLIVAIMAGILGFSVISQAATRIMSKEELNISYFTFTAMIISIATKIYMTIYFHQICKKHNSPAIEASEIDSRNDVLVSGAALIGITGAKFNIHGLDSIMALIIGAQIIRSGYEMGKRNIDFLIGKAPNDKFINLIKDNIKSIDEVVAFHDIRAHYVGNIIQVEIHIMLHKELSLIKAHAIGKMVQKKVEDIDIINKAFIHIDPCMDKKKR